MRPFSSSRKAINNSPTSYQELLQITIKNHCTFKTSYGDEDYGAVTNAMILKCKEWMIENKGNYILNADYPAY
jgi:hypothetical protein